MTSRICTTLPAAFCWTRFGVEAGQEVAAILARKETERQGNGGLFLWGVGNSIMPSLPLLVRACDDPKVVFSAIRTQPRTIDIAPGALAVWTWARASDGAAWPLPAHSLVTSHAGRALGRHYALVCWSDRPLRLNDAGPVFRMSELANLRSGRPVGASQITAIVRHSAQSDVSGPIYHAAMVVDLAPPYIVALEVPVVVSTEGLGDETTLDAAWAARKGAARAAPRAICDPPPDKQQYDLFA